MQRKLPVIRIADTDFYVDVINRELRDVGNPFNEIEFIEMVETRDGYTLCFDMQTKCVFRGSREEYNTRRDDMQEINLPPMHIMDPAGYIELMKRHEELVVDVVRNDSALPELVRRMMEPTEVEINGRVFYLDFYGEGLIDAEKGYSIPFAKMDSYKDLLMFWYDPLTGRQFQGTPIERSHRADLIRATVPVTKTCLPKYISYRFSEGSPNKQLSR